MNSPNRDLYNSILSFYGHKLSRQDIMYIHLAIHANYCSPVLKTTVENIIFNKLWTYIISLRYSNPYTEQDYNNTIINDGNIIDKLQLLIEFSQLINSSVLIYQLEEYITSIYKQIERFENELWTKYLYPNSSNNNINDYKIYKSKCNSLYK